ncbi:MAG: hypothetical protein HY615_15665 [Candidatus Rokubacteria bacterium]|nr:hypothetical protein [Candidatus Rokubacteria bacterium]
MAHPLAGQFAVEASARRLRAYRYVVERTMRALGGWIALTPELSAKLLLGRHVWDLAQHCDAFGRRLPELRAPAQVSEPANADVVALMDALEVPEAPGETIERLVGVYEVLKPHLVAVYRDHLARANAVYEPPTRLILARCIEDEARHVAAGAVILRHLTVTPELAERAVDRRRALAGLLAAAGGVGGEGLPVPPAPEPAVPEGAAEGHELIRLERAVAAWPFPPGLEATLRSFGDALARRETDGVRRWLAPECAWDAAATALESASFGAHRVVALARVGAHRLVKQRLDGPGGTAVVQSRWVAGDGGWRAVAVEVVRRERTSPSGR